MTEGKIVSLVTMKGGSGKSTTAMCLAGVWHRAGAAVAMVDADPGATVLRWREMGEDFQGVAVHDGAQTAFEDALAAARANGPRRLLIDTPGFKSPALEAALAASDLVVIPIRPSPVDFQVAADTADLVSRLTKGGRPLTRFLLCQTNRTSLIARHMRSEMDAAGYALFDTQIGSRVIFGEAALSGSTPTFVQPRGAAAAEIASLAREVDKLLDDPIKAPRSKKGKS